MRYLPLLIAAAGACASTSAPAPLPGTTAASPTLIAPDRASPARPPSAETAGERFDFKVRNYFFEGFRGDAEALDEGMRLCEQELAAHPANPEAMVWHGSGLLFRSGAAFRKKDVPAGRQLYARGREEVDRAVTLRSDNPAVRVVRGATYLGTSLFMPPSPESESILIIGVRDYEQTLELQKAALPQLSTHARGQLFYGMADGYQRLGDAAKARVFYERLVTEVPESPLVPRARAWLEGKPPTDRVLCVGCH